MRFNRVCMVFVLLLFAVPGSPQSVRSCPDIPKNHWAYQAVRELYNTGILAGDPGLYDADTPEYAWKSLLRAMQRGDEPTLRRLTTQEGYAALFRVAIPTSLNKRREVYRRRFHTWKNIPLTYMHFPHENQGSAILDFDAFKDGNYLILYFERSSQGWKLAGLAPGE
jgi:hypothetical protein